MNPSQQLKAAQRRQNFCSSDHRIERHYYSEDIKNTIKRYWDAKREGLGEKAVIEWLFHIAIDNLATAFRMSSKSFSYGPKTYNLMEFGFGRSGYIHCEFNIVDEADLHFIFEEEATEEDYHWFLAERVAIAGVLVGWLDRDSMLTHIRHRNSALLTTSLQLPKSGSAMIIPKDAEVFISAQSWGSG
jgi:hypothetical protein